MRGCFEQCMIMLLESMTETSKNLLVPVRLVLLFLDIGLWDDFYYQMLYIS